MWKICVWLDVSSGIRSSITILVFFLTICNELTVNYSISAPTMSKALWFCMDLTCGWYVKVQEKVVWIWPDESESAFIDSAMVEPHGMEYNNEEFVVLAPMFTRDLPYPVDVLLENIIDPSHLCYAHHGVQVSNRRRILWCLWTWLAWFFSSWWLKLQMTNPLLSPCE